MIGTGGSLRVSDVHGGCICQLQCSVSTGGRVNDVHGGCPGKVESQPYVYRGDVGAALEVRRS